MKKLLFLCALVLGACNGDSNGDGGSDATTESAVDLCDIDAFLASGGNGNACPHASSRVCFTDPTCEAGNGCTCKDINGSPTWSCYTPPECTGGCSLIGDAACDAGPDAPAEAGDDSSTDASDAGTD